MYFIVSLLVENPKISGELIKEPIKEKISLVVNKIHMVYKQIKKNERPPEADYSFQNAKHTNLEKTIEKLDKINNFGETFIPRI